MRYNTQQVVGWGLVTCIHLLCHKPMVHGDNYEYEWHNDAQSLLYRARKYVRNAIVKAHDHYKSGRTVQI